MHQGVRYCIVALLCAISLEKAVVADMLFLRQVTEGTPSLEYNGFNTKRARESGQQPGNKLHFWI